MKIITFIATRGSCWSILLLTWSIPAPFLVFWLHIFSFMSWKLNLRKIKSLHIVGGIWTKPWLFFGVNTDIIARSVEVSSDWDTARHKKVKCSRYVQIFKICTKRQRFFDRWVGPLNDQCIAQIIYTTEKRKLIYIAGKKKKKKIMAY